MAPGHVLFPPLPDDYPIPPFENPTQRQKFSKKLRGSNSSGGVSTSAIWTCDLWTPATVVDFQAFVENHTPVRSKVSQSYHQLRCADENEMAEELIHAETWRPALNPYTTLSPGRGDESQTFKIRRHGITDVKIGRGLTLLSSRGEGAFLEWALPQNRRWRSIFNTEKEHFSASKLLVLHQKVGWTNIWKQFIKPKPLSFSCLVLNPFHSLHIID